MKIIKYICFCYGAVVCFDIATMGFKQRLEMEPRSTEQRLQDLEEEVLTNLVSEKLMLQKQLLILKREAQETEMQLHGVEKRLMAKGPLFNKKQAKL